jgi:hypothetical protein
MLNGIDPILIFNLSKNVAFVKSAIEKKIPVASAILDKINLPAIPVYLGQGITGIQIDTEDKSLEIETSMETSANSGEASFINQRGLNNTVKVTMIAEKDSVGLTLLSALADFVFPLVTAKEVTITYLHGPITVFGGLLHSFNINQNASNTLYTISMELIRVGIAQPSPIPQIPATPNTILKAGTAVLPGV